MHEVVSDRAEVDLQLYASKAYVDARLAQHVSTAGGKMSGDLDMNNFQRVITLIDPANAQDAATKKYVDTLMAQPFITVWAESSGREGQFEQGGLF